MNKTKVVITAAGQIIVKANKKVEFSVSLSAERMLELSREDFNKSVSQNVFGNDLFAFESVTASHVGEDGLITLSIKGSIKEMVSAGKIQVIDQPQFVL
jgi:hypothetical protein